MLLGCFVNKQHEFQQYQKKHDEMCKCVFLLATVCFRLKIKDNTKLVQKKPSESLTKTMMKQIYKIDRYSESEGGGAHNDDSGQVRRVA